MRDEQPPDQDLVHARHPRRGGRDGVDCVVQQKSPHVHTSKYNCCSTGRLQRKVFFCVHTAFSGVLLLAVRAAALIYRASARSSSTLQLFALFRVQKNPTRSTSGRLVDVTRFALFPQSSARWNGRRPFSYSHDCCRCSACCIHMVLIFYFEFESVGGKLPVSFFQREATCPRGPTTTRLSKDCLGMGLDPSLS